MITAEEKLHSTYDQRKEQFRMKFDSFRKKRKKKDFGGFDL